MNKLLEIRKKQLDLKPRIEDLKEKFLILQSQLKLINEQNNERLTENEKKLDVSKIKITEMNDVIIREDKILEDLCQDLDNNNKLLKKNEITCEQLIMENDEIYKKIEEIRRMKPNNDDEKKLEYGRKKSDYFNLLTGIKWNYPTLSIRTEGPGVSNNINYIHGFSFENDDSQLESKVWNEIAKCIEHPTKKN